MLQTKAKLLRWADFYAPGLPNSFDTFKAVLMGNVSNSLFVDFTGLVQAETTGMSRDETGVRFKSVKVKGEAVNDADGKPYLVLANWSADSVGGRHIFVAVPMPRE